MGWTLAPGVGFCFAGDELILLDLRTDRYLALRGDRRAAFERLRARAPNDSEAMSALVATGLLVRCDSETKLDPPDVAVPQKDLGDRPQARLAMGMIAAAARHLLWARHAQTSDRLSHTIAELCGRKRTLTAAAGEERLLAETAAGYAAARSLIPIAPCCLIDSLALFRLMLHRELAPALVFGVRAMPFGAHCWLQSSERILTGSLDDAHNFTPILVL